MIISSGVFFYYSILKFRFSWLSGGAESAKYGPKWQEFLSVASYISRTIYHMTYIYGTHVGIFFIFFFQNFDFQDHWEEEVVKGHKMTQNDKNFCLSHSISQEPYIIWLWFLVHVCKMLISPDNVFQNFYFWGF